MTVTAVRKDPEALTLTLDAEFDAPAERVWQLWADPRQLERWWGPPTYPATVHDARPRARRPRRVPHDRPEGDQPKGYWEIVEADPPRRLAFRDGFANDDGTPNTDMPVNDVNVTIEELGDGRTRMSIQSIFASTERDGAAARHGHGAGPDRRPSARSTRSSPRTPSRRGPTERRRIEGDDDHDHRHLAHPGASPDPRGPGRDAHLRHPAQRRDHRAAARADRLAGGRRRLPVARQPLHRSDDRARTTRATAASAARPTTRPCRSPRRSRPTTSTGSSRRSAAGRSTCSRAAAAPSSRWRSSRSTRATSGPRSRTSRRSPRSCRTASTRSRRSGPSTRPTTGAAGARAWRTSSRS